MLSTLLSAWALAAPLDGVLADSWYLDTPVSQISIEGSEFSERRDRDYLTALLEVQSGDLYQEDRIREDLQMLLSVGDFSGVEAEVFPQYILLDEGPVLHVRLVYRVQRAPLIKKLRVRGNRALSKASILQAAGLHRGSRFLEQEDREGILTKIRGVYHRHGYPDAKVSIELEGERELSLTLLVEEGEGILLHRLSYTQADALTSRQRRAIERRFGLREGRRLPLEKLSDFRQALRDQLQENGWPSARVTLMELATKSPMERQLSVVMELGDQILIRSSGRGLPRQRAMRDLLGTDQGATLSPGFSEQAVEVLTQHLRRQGWLEPEVRVAVLEETGRQILEIQSKVGPRYRLHRSRGLTFTGQSMLAEEELLGALLAASPDVLSEGFATPEEIESKLEVLVDYYRTHGFMDASASLSRFEREGRRVLAEITVVEGSQTFLRSLHLEGVHPEARALIESRVSELVGFPFSPQALQRLSQELNDAHRALGYLESTTDWVLLPDEELGLRSAVMTVKRGELVRLKNILFRGLQRTRRETVESALSLRSGQQMTPALLEESRESLYELGVFSVAQTELVGEDPHSKDLMVRVRESAATSIEVGGGFNTDEGMRVYTRSKRRNIMGRAHSLQGLAQVGLGYIGDEWRLDTTQPEWRAALRYEAPQVLLHNKLVASALLREQALEPTYRLSRSAVSAGLSTQEDTSSVSVSYRLDWNTLEDVDPGALVLGDPWLEELGIEDPVSELGTYPAGPRRQGGLELLFLLDQRDDRFNPSQGLFASLQLDVWDNLSSEYVGSKIQGAGGVFIPAGPLRLYLDLQLGMGWMNEERYTLPVEERFRVGGASTLRGFELDSVGPKNKVSNQLLSWPDSMSNLVDYLSRDDPYRWVPVGGDTMAAVSLELIIPVPRVSEAFSTALFIDAGNVWFRSGVETTTRPAWIQDQDLGESTLEPLLRYGTGVGVRYATPVGPFQLDLGLNPLYQQVSWAKERGEVPWRIHFSLGAL